MAQDWGTYADKFLQDAPDTDGLAIFTRDGQLIECRGTESGTTAGDLSDIVSKQDKKNKKQEEGSPIQYKGQKYQWIRADDHATYYKCGKSGLSLYHGPDKVNCVTLLHNMPDVKPENRLTKYLHDRGVQENKP